MRAQATQAAPVLKSFGLKSTVRSLTMIAAVFGLSLSACTKTKETKSMVNPDAYVSVADFDGKIFSLVRGTEEADGNNVVGAIPGMSNDFGFVKVRVTQDEIQFIELFNLGNKSETQSILASYKIKDRFDIEREVNDFGESTQKIVEKKERPWAQRQFMRVDWSAPSNQSSALLTMGDTGGGPTAVENVVLLEDPKIEKGHISWLVEYSAPGESGWWGAMPNSRVVVRTHLTAVSKSDYQRLNYRDEDFKKFGFFFTQQQLEDPEKGLLDSNLEDHTFANLHNVCEPNRTDATGKALSCSTGKIVWHLTKNFPEKYKEVSRRVVSEWNDTFKESLGRKDDVVVLDESFQVDMVDPRYNTIAHYGAKSPGGLLGVAQWASNPETGELIGTRATIYEDGIRYMLGLVDDVTTMILLDDEVRQAFLATDAETQERIDKLFKRTGDFKVKDDVKNLRTTLGMAPAASKNAKRTNLLEVRRTIKDIAAKLQEPAGRSIDRKAKLMQSMPELFKTTEQAKFSQPMSSYDQAFGLLGARHATAQRLPSAGGLEYLHDVGSSLREERMRMINQAETGVHGSELVEEATLRYIRKVLSEHPEAADFRAQIAVLKNEVDQKTFYTTLLHEMGHTFGLRHNFQGSADAKHYHPEFFRLSKQMELEKDLPADQKTVTEADLQPYMFSSIMDYGGDFYSQVGGLGPYDKAAIKYAYNRSIDKAKDPVVTAQYQFCTDHQVNESILCRRFDKGRNVSEITFNLIEGYQTNWVLSHYRRDRANFERRARSYPMNALVRYMVPVRQVMDEFLFALIDAKTVAAKENECDMEYWRKSVDKGEIVNICNPVEAEQAGVDPTSLETFEAGLFDENGLRKNPNEFEPNGLADLLFANILAKQFFSDVLGSTEPGQYIAMPVSKGVFSLEKIPAGKDLEESLTAFASEKELPTTPEVLDQLKSLVGEVKVGRYGKPFNSEWDESGSSPKQKNVGAFWDKYIAMVALGLKDIGVSKYARHSMTGNAYAYPNTTGFASKIIKSMITQTDRLSTVPFKTPAGILPATVEPTLNLDVRAIATITALTDFVSDSDESIADKMRVCSVDEKGCTAKFGQKVVEFATSSGQDVYRSVQTLNGDSISFDLLTAAAAIDKQRNDWVSKQQKASDLTADNIMKVTELTATRAHLEKTLADLNIKDMNEILPTLLSADPKTPSMWALVNILATQGEQVPLFTTMNLAQQAGGVLNAAAQILGKAIQDVDPNGLCKDATPVEDPVADPATKKLPAVTGLKALLKNRKFSLRSVTTLDGAANEPAPETPVATVKPECSEIVAKRAILMTAGNEFQVFATGIGSILNNAVNAKVAPLRAKRLTDELARSEANIKLIRKVSKATGLE
ncbi:hypothetical protein BH10BDE1_BH10BDE1_09200 [soil metagenome]